MIRPLTEIVNRACQHCGTSFSPRAATAKYCGRACYLAARIDEGPALFWAKVDKNGANGCWLYMGFRKWDGYGWLARWQNGKPKNMTAHRYAWILTHGEPPAGMHIMHECDNPPCCNPDHLSLGTKDDNAKDAVSKGRNVGGYHIRKLTAEDVAEIRKLKGVVQSGELSRRFGVEQPHIINIWNRKVWRSV